LENRQEKEAQAGGASGKANCLSASAVSPFSAGGRSIPAPAGEAADVALPLKETGCL